MRTTIFAVALILLVTSCANIRGGNGQTLSSAQPLDARPATIPGAKTESDRAAVVGEIVDRYLAAPWAKGVARSWPGYETANDEAKQARLAILTELEAMPEEAVPAVERVVFGQATSLQRLELVRVLLHIHTRKCAELLHRVAEDVREPDGENDALCEDVVRQTAVRGLGRMAKRTDRTSHQRIPRRPEFSAKVPGLVPYLISATDDKAVRVRLTALIGLADCRDPRAVPALRACLKDTNTEVRRYAACYLTEYHDATGLPEMRAALSRLKDARIGTEHYALEMLFASFERITGKSFGEIPTLDCVWEASEIRRYRELHDAWAAWWDWQPVQSTKRG